MKTICMLVATAAALTMAAAATDAKDPKKDARRNYSTDGWKLEWSDEFDGKEMAPSAENWRPEVGFIRNQEPQYYTSNRVENCCVKDGVLTITARKEKWANPLYKDRHLGGWYRQREFANYTSADLQSRRTFHYGRVEFRAQMPGGWGAWPALWFLGDNLRLKPSDPEYFNWPACGEIDLVEIWGNNPTRVAACLHTVDRGPNPDEKKYKPNEHHKVTGGGEFSAKKEGLEPWNGFHTYTLDWYEDRMYMFYDGHLYADIDLSRSDWPDGRNPFRKPMFIIMNLALGGYGNKVVDVDTVNEKTGKTIPAAKFPMEMKVDWVRYYRR
ncbi:MAG: glycoside hydrolase family 16 protein [Kiritimatiellae bacterium]|nr:glycoside hydrolase family 16 protein [Kiritimatiellia bacterium]